MCTRSQVDNNEVEVVSLAAWMELQHVYDVIAMSALLRQRSAATCWCYVPSIHCIHLTTAVSILPYFTTGGRCLVEPPSWDKMFPTCRLVGFTQCINEWIRIRLSIGSKRRKVNEIKSELKYYTIICNNYRLFAAIVFE